MQIKGQLLFYMTCAWRLCGVRVQQKHNGTCGHFNWRELHHQASSNSVPCCMSLALFPQLWSSDQVNPSATKSLLDTLKVIHGTSTVLCPTQMESLLFSQPDILRTHFLNIGCLSWGTWCETGTPSSQGHIWSGDISPYSQPLYMGVGPADFMCLPFLPVSMWLPLYILSYWNSVQLGLRLYSVMVVL